MAELTRRVLLDELAAERKALMGLLTRLQDAAWRELLREDGWSVHDIVAHVADVHLSTVAISGVSPRTEWSTLGVTLPMLPNGRVNTERLNMLRYQLNLHRTRENVMSRLVEGFDALEETVRTLSEERLAGPGPYGPSEPMLGWFYAAVSHSRKHRLELEAIFAQVAQD